MALKDHTQKHVTGQIGVNVRDLVANVHALVTEGETGELLQERLRELRASANALLRHSEMIATLREASHVGRCAEASRSQPEHGSCSHVQPGAPACTECLYGPIKRRSTMEAYEKPRTVAPCGGCGGFLGHTETGHTETCDRGGPGRDSGDQ